MGQQLLFVDASAGTAADIFLAVGVASLIREVLLQVSKPSVGLTISDEGDTFRISIPVPLTRNELDQVAPFSLVEPLVTGKAADLAEQDGKVLGGFPYDLHRRKRDEYRFIVQQLPPNLRTPKALRTKHPQLEQIAHAAPDERLEHYVLINSMIIAPTFNQLANCWTSLSQAAFSSLLRLLFDHFSSAPNPSSEHFKQAYAQLAGEFPELGRVDATALQLVNPTAGKGANHPKANKLHIGNLDGTWPLELLKLAGYFIAGIPVRIRASDDRKLYVARPVRVEFAAFDRIMRDFRPSLWPATSIKLDILAALRFVQVYLERWQAARTVTRHDADFAWFRKPEAQDVKSVVSSFEVVQFKRMGPAYATMNQATINLPAWAPAITSPEQADTFLDLLTEHEGVITSIKTTKGDEGSDEIELLRRYRDFLSGRDAVRFFDFAAHYGDYYLAKQHHNQWAAQFTTYGMETLVRQSAGNEDLRDIYLSHGFRTVAKAIRRSTGTARFYSRQTQGPAYPYEVRYGLGRDLLRQAAYPKQFLGALSEFILTYKDENNRVEDRIAKNSLPDLPHFHRPDVDESDLDQIIDLVTKFGSEIVCKLLVAYGYARDARTPGEPVTVTPSGEELLADGDEAE